MPMEQWPGPCRDEDNGGCWDEMPEDEPGQWLDGADYEPNERFPGELMMGAEYWLFRRDADEDDNEA